MNVRVWIALASAFAAPAVARQDSPPPSHPRELRIPARGIHAPPDVRVLELEGGTRLLTLVDPTSPVVSGVLRFRAGSAEDPPTRPGLARLCALSLLDPGDAPTPERSPLHWAAARGASLEVRLVEDALELRFQCEPADTLELLEQLFWRLGQPTYPEPALARARRALGAKALRRLADPMALTEHGIELATRGFDSSAAKLLEPQALAALTRDDVLSFHRTRLGRERLTVALCGALELDPLRTKLTGLLEGLRHVSPAASTPAPSFDQPARTTVFLIDRPGRRAQLRIVAPGIRRRDPDYPALELWSRIVGRGGRLHRARRVLCDELALGSDARVSFDAEWSRAGLFTASLSTAADGARPALDALLELLEEARADPDEESVTRARQRLLAGAILAADTPRERLERALDLDWHGYPRDFWSRHTSALRQLDGAAVGAAARRRLQLESLVIVAVGPAESLAPQLESLGSVQRVDPLAPPAPGSDQPLLTQALFEAVGGRLAWSQLDALETEVQVQTSAARITTTQWHDLERLRFRADYLVRGEGVSVRLDGDTLIQVDPSGVARRTPSEAQREGDVLRRGLWHVLRAVARNEGVSVRALDARRLAIDGPGDQRVVLTLDAQARPRRLESQLPSGEELAHTFADWNTSEGLAYPERIVEEATGTVWRVERFTPLARFDPQLVALE